MIHTDFETYSEANLRTVGAYRYAEDPSTEVLILCYAFDDGSVQLWLPGMPAPEQLFERVADGEEFCAHNAMFEHCIWNIVLQRHLKKKPPRLKASQLNCTAVRSAMCGLPRGLEGAGAALGAPVQKDKRGGRLIKLFCVPRKPTKRDPRTRILPSEDRASFNEFIAYCKTDVLSERSINKLLPPLTAFERRMYALDARFNERGIPIDVPLARKASVITAELAARAKAKVEALTGGVRPTQRDRMLDWLAHHGQALENLQAGTVNALLANSDIELDDTLRTVLEIRVDAAKASVKKLAAMHRVAMRDNRIRGMFLVYGAHTGRWSAKLVQPHNFIRGLLKPHQQALIFRLIDFGDADLFEMLYDKPMTAIAQVMRGFIRARKGYRLIVVDYEQIEARILAWLSNEITALEAYRSGKDRYVIMAALLFNIPEEQVTVEQRRIAKNFVLGCGYGLGWRGAIAYCAKQDVIIDDELSQQGVTVYRQSNPETVKTWGDVGRCAIAAVRTRKPVHLRNLTFEIQGRYLTIKLPSGRRLYYPYPRIEMKERFGRPEMTLTYRTQYMGKWIRTDTWGGSLVENIVQAIACDVMVYGGVRCEQLDYSLIGTVHDELISEVKIDKGTIAEMEQASCHMPPWAAGCPITAKGFETERYRKG